MLCNLAHSLTARDAVCTPWPARGQIVSSLWCAPFQGLDAGSKRCARTVEPLSTTHARAPRDNVTWFWLAVGLDRSWRQSRCLKKKNERSLFIIILRGRGGVGVGWFGAIETAGFFVYIYIYIFYLNVCGFRFVVAHLSLCIIHFYTRCLWKNWLLDVTNRGVKRVFFLLFNVCYFPLMYLLHWILSMFFF